MKKNLKEKIKTNSNPLIISLYGTTVSRNKSKIKESTKGNVKKNIIETNNKKPFTKEEKVLYALNKEKIYINAIQDINMTFVSFEELLKKHEKEINSLKDNDILNFKNYLHKIEHDLISHPNVGGIILFTRNYESKKQLKLLTSNIKKIAKDANKENFFICVDQEGGLVQRFKDDFTIIPSAKEIGLIYKKDPKKGLTAAKKYGKIMAQELKECGIDFSLAPTCDLDLGNKVISGKDRAYHADPNDAIKILSAFIDGMNSMGMFATGKHFPGHGMGGIGDSHKKQPIDNRSFEELAKNDLLVFKTLIKNKKLHAIMPSHIVYDKVDPDNTAGTSKIWLDKILKKDLKFDGIIISDCLSMSGAKGNNLLDKNLKALEFGDYALFCNQPPWIFMDVADKLSNHISKSKIRM